MKILVDKLTDSIRNDTSPPEELQEEMLAYVHEWAKEHDVEVKEASEFFYMASTFTVRLALARQRKAQGKSSTEPSSTCNC